VFSLILYGPINHLNAQWLSFLGMLLIATPMLGITNCLTSILLAFRKTSRATFVQYLAFQLCLVIILMLCLAFKISNIRESLIYEIFFISYC